MALVNEYPADAYINYQCAWSFDCLGEETQAVPYYEIAIHGDLRKDDLHGAYLGLGSTYRALGEYEKSKHIFEKAIQQFPEDVSLKVFYAMTLYNLQKHSEAMELLLKCLTNTTKDETILMYKQAIEFYADKLDETWE